MGKRTQPKVGGQSDRRIRIVHRALAELKLDPKNPRVHSPRQVRQIARSIKAFGFNIPILVDAIGKVIAGHGRLLACQLLGWTEVPTISLDHLSEAQARAFMIADNRLTENSAWDDRLLAEQLRDLSELELDFNLEVTGFEVGEIDLRIESLSSPAPNDSADDLSEVSLGPPVTRVGDEWTVGKSRVHCASALEAAAYAALMQGEQALMVFSDPPYNVRIDGNVSGLGKQRHREFAMASGEMSEFEFTRFLLSAMSLFARHSVSEASQGQFTYQLGDMYAWGPLKATIASASPSKDRHWGFARATCPIRVPFGPSEGSRINGTRVAQVCRSAT
jgi:hypothetical protein